MPLRHSFEIPSRPIWIVAILPKNLLLQCNERVVYRSERLVAVSCILGLEEKQSAIVIVDLKRVIPTDLFSERITLFKVSTRDIQLTKAKAGHRVLKPETGRLIFTFHHWQPRAWAALSAALNSAGFALLNHYVVHAEHPISVHISKMRALTHDAILVLALRDPNILPRWPRPRSIDHTDSFRFTETCAGYLGWILDQPDLSRAEIEGLWAEFLSADDGTVSAGNKVP